MLQQLWMENKTDQTIIDFDLLELPIQQLSNLHTLHVTNCKVSDQHLSILQQLPSLTELHLLRYVCENNSSINEQTILSLIEHLPSMKRFLLLPYTFRFNIHISTPTMAILCTAWNQLRYLGLGLVSFTDSMFASIGTCTQLIKLVIVFSAFVDDTTTSTYRTNEHESIDVMKIPSSAGYSSLTKLSALTFLYLLGPQPNLNVTVVEYICTLKHLNALFLSGCFNLPECEPEQLLSTLPLLSSITIARHLH
jgi:hypothetical protein